ncbi:MAG: YezD family protein [Oscillospiraceae bacterium]|nr:YezD family protein [Oscillospiraceae bacterium]
MEHKNNSGGKRPISDSKIEQIQKLAEGLRYGTITLVFQDGVLIQLDRNEKIRIEK